MGRGDGGIWDLERSCLSSWLWQACKLSFQAMLDGSLESPRVTVMVVPVFTLSMSSNGMTGEGKGPKAVSQDEWLSWA